MDIEETTSKRVTKKEKEQRVEEVVKMYYANKGTKQDLKKQIMKKWNIQKRQAENYLKEAMVIVRIAYDPDVQAARSKWIHEMNSIYYDIKNSGDPNHKLQITALVELGKMQGLYAVEPTVNVNVTDSKQIEVKKMSRDQLEAFVATGVPQLPAPDENIKAEDIVDAEIVEDE